MDPDGPESPLIARQFCSFVMVRAAATDNPDLPSKEGSS
jgi:hypothetical protein